MAFFFSCLALVAAYELHKRKNHGAGLVFDVLAIGLLFASWRAK
jgi:hypothetical protein